MVTLGMIVMGHPEFYLAWKPEAIAADGSVSDDTLRPFLETFIDAFAQHVARLAPTA